MKLSREPGCAVIALRGRSHALHHVDQVVERFDTGKRARLISISDGTMALPVRAGRSP